MIGILAGHFGWGKRWPAPFGKLHPDYLTGLDYLVTEQPDRALDMFLKLMDANADTIETHFALGSLYRRRGEVERAIRIHQNLLAREALAPEHREQALLALAQDYLRAGLLDRAEGLFQQVSEVPRLRASALDSLRGVYERQHDWQQALETYRQLARIKAAPPRTVAAHYLCELATTRHRARRDRARRGICCARRATEAKPFPRAALLRAQIAEREGQPELAVRLLQQAHCASRRSCCRTNCLICSNLVGAPSRDAVLAELVAQAAVRDFGELKRLVFAAIAADLATAEPLRAADRTGVLAGCDTEGASGRRPAQVGAHRAGNRCIARARGEISVQRMRLCGAQFLLALSRPASLGTASSPTPSLNCARNPL